MKKIIIVSVISFCATLICQAQISDKPVDQWANEEVKELYSYLLNDVWEKRVISGCQAEWDYNTNDAEKIYEACGKYPKINIFDFQHFDQSWRNYRTNIAKNWHDQGGIVGFMWHIHMPCNAFAENKEGWTNFYSNGEHPCHISPKNAATEGTLENKIFKEKLDGVADLLLLYQSQGIPILFRPLHEAAGGWFWWANDGAEGFKKLWTYMFNYFADKGIHNLIWIWTSEINDKNWYPGDEYVDIVGRDCYPENNTTHISNVSDFNYLKRTYPNKMICMPECNSVPSWDNMEKDGAMWLFVAPWCGGGAFSNGNDNAFWNEFMSEENIITR